MPRYAARRNSMQRLCIASLRDAMHRAAPLRNALKWEVSVEAVSTL